MGGLWSLSTSVINESWRQAGGFGGPVCLVVCHGGLRAVASPTATRPAEPRDIAAETQRISRTHLPLGCAAADNGRAPPGGGLETVLPGRTTFCPQKAESGAHTLAGSPPGNLRRVVIAARRQQRRRTTPPLRRWTGGVPRSGERLGHEAQARPPSRSPRACPSVPRCSGGSGAGRCPTGAGRGGRPGRATGRVLGRVLGRPQGRVSGDDLVIWGEVGQSTPPRVRKPNAALRRP